MILRFRPLTTWGACLLAACSGHASAEPAGTLPKMDVSVVAECGDEDKLLPATITGHKLRLTVPPDSTWVGWSREAGVDLVFAITPQDDTSPMRIDSAPARHAFDPWWLHADQNGRVEIGLQALGRSRSRGLSARLRCLEDLTPSERARWRSADRFARRLNEWFDLGGSERAWHWMGDALQLGRQIDGDVDTRIWLDFQLAAAARRAGFLEQSRQWFDLAAGRARQQNQGHLEAMARLWAAKAALGLGDIDTETRLEAARQRAEDVGLEYAASVAAQDLCISKRLAGKFDEASECYRAAIAVSRKLEEWSDLAIAQSNLANALVTQGDLNGAREALDGALETATQHDSPRVRWMASKLLAQMQTWSGQYVEALATMDQTLRTLDSNRPIERAQLLATLAGTYALMGEHPRALGIYESVIADMHARGQSVRAQIFSLYAAEMDLRLEQPQQAAERLQDWLDSEPPESAAAAVRIGRLIRARAFADLGQRDAALAEYRRIGMNSEQWDWPRRMRALGLELSLDLIRGEDARMALEQAGRTALEQAHDLAHLEAVALALADDPALPSAESLPWFSAEAADRVRSTASLLRSPELRSGLISRLRPLVDRVAHGVPTGPATSDVVRGALLGLEELRAIEQIRPATEPGPELAMLERSVVIETLGADRPDTAPAADTAALNWYASFHRLANRQKPAIRVRGWTEPRLAQGDRLIYPVLGEQRASLFIADHDGWRVVAGLDAAAVRESAAVLNRMLESGLADRTAIASAASRLARDLRWLAPDATHRVSRLYMVADQSLGGVPWELLPSFDHADAMLGESTELVILQSMRAAQALPAFSRIVTTGGNSGGSGSLAALNEANAELEDVAEAWSSTLQSARLGNSAESLSQALLSPAALVHVAGHALVGRGWAEDQGIWLGSADAPEFFSALRLAQTPSRAALVVLNACETGRVVTPSRIGLSGAAGGLANSGAGMVIATRWAVSDRTARRFATLLHKELRESPGEPARALRRAQQSLRAMPAFRHPAEWAAWFVLAPGVVVGS